MKKNVTKKSRPAAGMLTSAQAISRLVEVVGLCPELKEGLPANCGTAAFWRKLFNTNDQTRRILLVLRECPAFNEMAPRKGDLKGWRKAMSSPYGTEVHSGSELQMLIRDLLRASKENPLPAKRIKYWREKFGPEEWVQRVRPEETNDWLPNPHRGTTTFQRFQGDGLYPTYFTSDTHGPVEFRPDARAGENARFVPRTTLTYVRWPWAWLEPVKGQFRWDIVDRSLETARNRGQTVQLRFQPYTLGVDYSKHPPKSMRHPPEKSVNVPDWYWDTGAAWIPQGTKGTYTAHEPDCNDPMWLQHFGDFVRAFGQRYDGHEDLESIDIAYGGFWGEGGGNSTPETGQKLAEIYLEAFRKTQLLGMLGTPGMAHAVEVGQMAGRHIGWRADCFGDLNKAIVPEVPMNLTFNHTHDAYPEQIERCGVHDGWRTAPVTMETCGNAATWFIRGYDMERIVSEGYKYHMSVFMPKSVFYPAAIRDQLIEFDKRIGYRFVLRQLLMPLEAKAGQPVTFEFYLDNVGCAPIYRPYPFAVRFRQGDASRVVHLKADIRSWEPGIRWFRETFDLPLGLTPGEAKVDMAIVREDKDQPRVWFAMKEKLADGWHPLTSIEVK